MYGGSWSNFDISGQSLNFISSSTKYGRTTQKSIRTLLNYVNLLNPLLNKTCFVLYCFLITFHYCSRGGANAFGIWWDLYQSIIHFDSRGSSGSLERVAVSSDAGCDRVSVENIGAWWSTLLLSTFHVRRRHGEHSPCVPWLSRHHSAHSPPSIRAIVTCPD